MISRSSLKLEHLGSKSRSPGQISVKSSYHSSGHIFQAIIMNFSKYLSWWILGQVRNWVTWSQKLGHRAKSAEIFINALAVTFLSNHHESCSKCLAWWFLGQVRNWVTWGQKLGHLAKSAENLVNTLVVTFFKQSSWILLNMFVSMISRSSLKLGHLRSNTRSPGQICRKPC